MQNIQKNPMVTVAEAAAALGIDERTVREKLSKDEWKGEKRLIGMKEKWFMFRGELDRQIERLRIMRPQERASTVGLEEVFESEPIEAQPIEVQDVPRTSQNLSIAIDEVLSKLTDEFSKQLNAEKEVSFALKKELDEKDRQLRLLPDLQKLAESERQAAELKAMEVEALRKQIAALEEQRQAAEEQASQLKSEKEAETKAIQEQLSALTAQLQELKEPWWKKWFAPGKP